MKSIEPQVAGACNSAIGGTGGPITASVLGTLRNKPQLSPNGNSGHNGLLDHHVVVRHVIVHALAAGLHRLDAIDNIGAGNNLSEHRIAPALRIRGRVVKELVVGHVDEELRGGRVRYLGACHRHCVVLVLQAVVGFVLDRLVGGLLLHAGFETAALDHEARNDAMEYCVVVVALIDVVQKVSHRFGGLVLVQLEDNHAVSGDVEFDLGIAHGHFYFTSVAEVMTTGVL